MGWTAVTGSCDWPGVVLFGILFLWQLPHFLAIAIYRRQEYERAGIRTVPSVRGIAAAKRQTLFWSASLLPVSLLLVPFGVAGWIYLALAAVLGLVLVGYAIAGFRAQAENRWARGFFLYTLVYLTLLFAALVVDAGPGPLHRL
jgi:protoheme IX farnesyltransferase